MPPSLLDGATVLTLAYGDFGRGINDSRIMALAVAHYDDDSTDSFYLFACDENWNVVGDLLYSSAEKAQLDAERFFGVSPIRWQAKSEATT
jgi:hypothetical protein